MQPRRYGQTYAELIRLTKENETLKSIIKEVREDLKKTLQINKHHIDEDNGYEEEWVVLDVDHIQYLIDMLRGE